MFKAEFRVSKLTEIPQDDGRWSRTQEDVVTKVEVTGGTEEEVIKAIWEHVEVEHQRFGPVTR